MRNIICRTEKYEAKVGKGKRKEKKKDKFTKKTVAQDKQTKRKRNIRRGSHNYGRRKKE